MNDMGSGLILHTVSAFPQFSHCLQESLTISELREGNPHSNVFSSYVLSHIFLQRLLCLLLINVLEIYLNLRKHELYSNGKEKRKSPNKNTLSDSNGPHVYERVKYLTQG